MKLAHFDVANYLKEDSEFKNSTDFPIKKFRNVVNESEIFVINMSCFNIESSKVETSNPLLAMPFKSVSINFSVFNKIGAWLPIGNGEGIVNFIAYENSPGSFDFCYSFVNIEQYRSGNPYDLQIDFSCDLDIQNSENKILGAFRSLLSLINHKKNIIGIEKCKKYLQVSKHNEKKKISRIIHIGKKYETTEIRAIQSGRKIEWSHLWSVRGHWRKHEGIGKDREGIYQIPGYTFVRDHVKGIGEEVIKKIRVVA